MWSSYFLISFVYWVIKTIILEAVGRQELYPLKTEKPAFVMLLYDTMLI